MSASRLALVLLSPVLLAPAFAQPPPPCESCAAWNESQKPFRIHGNTYYVGTHGLGSILITSNEGHVLIDGALPESAPRIVESIRALGFRIEDVKLIVNSHVHFDHAGGIAELQRLSGASVAASEPSAKVLRQGRSGPDDPQYGVLPPIATVKEVKVVDDGETLHVGPIALTAHRTPGHTPGGTSWTWSSCEAGRCLNMVYADSLTAVSADTFLFSRSSTYPHALKDFEKSFETLSSVPCDVLITPHPGASAFWARLEKRHAGVKPDPLVDPSACRRYADKAREQLGKRVARENSESRGD